MPEIIANNHSNVVRWARFATRLFWTMTIGLLVCAAIYISVARQLLPTVVPGYKADIETRLTEILHAPVNIKQLNAEIVGFNPQLDIDGVQIGSQTTIKKIKLKLDVIDTFINWQPRLADVQGSGITAVLIKQDNGWQLGELFFPKTEQQDFSWVAMLSQIHITESHVDITLGEDKSFSVENVSLQLNQLGKKQHIVTDIALPNKKVAHIIAEGKGQWSAFHKMKWDMYLYIPEMDWLPWVENITDDYVVIKKLVGAAQVWLRWREEKFDDVRVRVELPSLDWEYVSNKEKESVQGMHADFIYQQKSGKSIFSVPTFSFIRDTKNYQLGGWSFSEQSTNNKKLMIVQVDNADIESFVQMALASKLLPVDAQEALAGLNPRGRFQQANAIINTNQNGLLAFDASGHLVDVALDAWDGSPQVSGVDGKIEFNKNGGHFALDSSHYQMTFPDLFSSGWQFDRAQGDLYWSYDNEKFVIRSGLLTAKNDDATVFGRFDYTSPYDTKQDDHLGLQLGFRDIAASARMHYIPDKELDKSLVEWLDAAILQGRVVDGAYLYDGAVVSDAYVNATSEVTLDVKDVSLKFDPSWPELKNISGSMVYDNDGLHVQVPSAQLLDAQLHNINVTLPYDSEDLHISGHAAAAAAAVMDLLRTTPLHQQVGTAMDSWLVKGDAAAYLDLLVPLNQKPAQVDVSAVLQNTQLTIPDIDLAFSDMNGDLRYNTQRGLNSKNISGVCATFDMPVSTSIATLPNDKTLTAKLRTQGKVDVDKLAKWLPSSLWSYVSGQLPYNIELQLPLASTNPLKLVINSSLTGTAIKMPTPFGKAANQPRDMQTAITFNGKDQRVEFRVKKEPVNGVVLVKGSEPLQANIVLGDQAALSEPTANGIRITGNTPTVVTDEWIAFLGGDKKQKTQFNSTSIDAAVDIRVANLQGFNQTIPNTQLRVGRVDAAWKVGLASDIVTGDITLPDNNQQALDIDLQQLHLPTATPTMPNTPRVDPLVSVDPNQLPAAQVKIDDFMVGTDHYGKWYFVLRPTKDGVTIKNIQIDNMKQFSIMSDESSWIKAKNQPISQTLFKGTIKTGNLNTALKEWGYNSGIESQEAQFDANLSWPGSPAMFSVADGSGNLKFAFKKGRFIDTGGKANMLKVFSLFNAAALARRLTLDFSDLYESGVSYDDAQGNIKVADGVATFVKPMTITGPSSDFKITGSTNLKTGQMDQEVVITPPVGQNATLIATVLCGPACGGVTYLVQKVLGSGIKKLASVKYKMTGSFENPEMEKETITTTDTSTPSPSTTSSN